MAKISVIGICGNSVFMYADHFHSKGETLVADECFEEIGGKGINQAIASARMGAEVSFLAAVGDDADGEKCRNTVKENNLKDFLVAKKGKRTTFAFILTDKNGENRVTEYVGAELEVDDVFAFEQEIANSDILLLQHEVPTKVNEAAVEIAKKHNVKVILNPAPIREISDRVAENVYIVTPNEQEKTSISPERFANVVTTLGDKGCKVNEEVFIPALKVKAVDTTGAGDTFNGVLAVCLADGMDLENACRYAVTASGLSVTKPYVLNSIPRKNEIEEKLLKQ